MSTPDSNALADRVRRVFVRSLSLDLDPEALPPSPDLTSLAGFDSLAILEFVAGLEKEFGIEIENERLTMDFLGNLDALVGYLAERLGSPRREQ